MNMNNPYLRMLALIVATAAAIHLAWVLIRPALPFLLVVVSLLGTARVIHWWRNNRW